MSGPISSLDESTKFMLAIGSHLGNRSRDSQVILRASRLSRYISPLTLNFVNRKAATNMAGPGRGVFFARGKGMINLLLLGHLISSDCSFVFFVTFCVTSKDSLSSTHKPMNEQKRTKQTKV